MGFLATSPRKILNSLAKMVVDNSETEIEEQILFFTNNLKVKYSC